MPARQLTDLDHAASRYLRTRAADRGITQKELALAADIPPSTFNRYWKGTRSMSLGDLKALISALGDTLDEGLAEIERLLVESE
ncbi:helix-turn-helix transcriptional regulator [uncultured Microbacterium sp.]|uniref:helix-turn-helix domain-containing protein n=1 Tax=uncultured Microbacterium sp. TaxID=191216 RepID=UPI0025CCE968|nr:helix-turn-helix transcriptional regulator [uncultured Microbacterium sp.]